MFRLWLRRLNQAEWQGDLDEGFSTSAVRELAGFLTYRFLHLYSRDLSPLGDSSSLMSDADLRAFFADNFLLDSVVRTERLEEDLVRVLEAAGFPLGEHQRRRIQEARRCPAYASRHRETAFYYDRETARLVAEKEWLILEKFDYSAPGAELMTFDRHFQAIEGLALVELSPG